MKRKIIKLDDFYTKRTVAKKCIDFFLEKSQKFIKKEKEIIFLEPSAGNGAFSLQLGKKNKVISLDINPQHRSIKKQDFLTFDLWPLTFDLWPLTFYSP